MLCVMLCVLYAEYLARDLAEFLVSGLITLHHIARGSEAIYMDLKSCLLVPNQPLIMFYY